MMPIISTGDIFYIVYIFNSLGTIFFMTLIWMYALTTSKRRPKRLYNISRIFVLTILSLGFLYLIAIVIDSLDRYLFTVFFGLYYFFILPIILISTYSYNKNNIIRCEKFYKVVAAILTLILPFFIFSTYIF